MADSHSLHVVQIAGPDAMALVDVIVTRDVVRMRASRRRCPTTRRAGRGVSPPVIPGGGNIGSPSFHRKSAVGLGKSRQPVGQASGRGRAGGRDRPPGTGVRCRGTRAPDLARRGPALRPWHVTLRDRASRRHRPFERHRRRVVPHDRVPAQRPVGRYPLRELPERRPEPGRDRDYRPRGCGRAAPLRSLRARWARSPMCRPTAWRCRRSGTVPASGPSRADRAATSPCASTWSRRAAVTPSCPQKFS